MSYDNSEREMFEGNWKCGSCSGAITKLPFKPDPDREGGLKCSDCFKKGSGGQGSGPREMHQGNWDCSKCGGKITQLPFQPDPARTNTLVCLDCFKKSKD